MNAENKIKIRVNSEIVRLYLKQTAFSGVFSVIDHKKEDLSGLGYDIKIAEEEGFFRAIHLDNGSFQATKNVIATINSGLSDFDKSSQVIVNILSGDHMFYDTYETGPADAFRYIDVDKHRIIYQEEGELNHVFLLIARIDKSP